MKRSMLSNSLGVAALKFGSLPVTLLTSVFLARTLGARDFGDYSYYLSLAKILAIPLGMGLLQLVLRETASAISSQDWNLLHGVFRRSTQWYLFASAILFLAGAGYLIFFAGEKTTKLILTAACVLSLASLIGLIAILAGVLQGMRKPFAAQLSNLFLMPFLALCFTAAFYFTLPNAFDLNVALCLQVLAAALCSAFGLILARRYAPAQVRGTTASFEDRKWLAAMVPFSLMIAASAFNNEVGILFLGWLSTSTEVAGLRVAQSAAQLVGFPVMIANIILAPHVSILARAGIENRSELQKLYTNSAKISFFSAVMIALLLGVLGDFILEVLFGERYIILSFWPMIIITFGNIFGATCGSAGTFLTMAGHEKDTLAGQAIAAAFTSISAVLLIPHFGAVGAAMSVTLGLIAWNLLLAIRLNRRLGIRVGIRSFLT
ncbi:polysaccharide biosynthesis C-terminal domain-containing protein [Novosphingobium album (ex Liu et al. 2023)]|uniref:Polysaccharide biosynthesis C-terminal domain-containing protein n=1 Tax=Novosphingobium album (ex Liu et al. 2023) TaxID=3031130 RepID=A0ABT5WQI0_9SPHN|nr:polysaccharide biosynthesis C-terminal domain-containing protein [Novosphingobium album (ex Liu et al. 2023)]MDE8652279.1 polysaccharide biosynthesis C-terminal domain-containing protein [Novosphingobium album (ex Liu et al. 2023)]